MRIIESSFKWPMRTSRRPFFSSIISSVLSMMCLCKPYVSIHFGIIVFCVDGALSKPVLHGFSVRSPFTRKQMRTFSAVNIKWAAGQALVKIWTYSWQKKLFWFCARRERVQIQFGLFLAFRYFLQSESLHFSRISWWRTFGSKDPHSNGAFMWMSPNYTYQCVNFECSKWRSHRIEEWRHRDAFDQMINSAVNVTFVTQFVFVSNGFSAPRQLQLCKMRVCFLISAVTFFPSFFFRLSFDSFFCSAHLLRLLKESKQKIPLIKHRLDEKKEKINYHKMVFACSSANTRIEVEKISSSRSGCSKKINCVLEMFNKLRRYRFAFDPLSWPSNEWRDARNAMHERQIMCVNVKKIECFHFGFYVRTAPRK